MSAPYRRPMNYTPICHATLSEQQMYCLHTLMAIPDNPTFTRNNRAFAHTENNHNRYVPHNNKKSISLNVGLGLRYTISRLLGIQILIHIYLRGALKKFPEFFDIDCFVHHELVSPGQNVTGHFHVQDLQRLSDAVGRKRRDTRQAHIFKLHVICNSAPPPPHTHTRKSVYSNKLITKETITIGRV
jgi:hypothetical protein